MKHSTRSYYAVIFTSELNDNPEGYTEMAQKIEALAKQQKGFLGMESAREKTGITISYWETLEDIKNWKTQSEHLIAQQLGKEKWYKKYTVRVCKVEREYGK